MAANKTQMETTITIDINDYLSESEKKEYAIESFKETMKKAIIDAYDQGRSDEETRFPFADDGENYYNLKFLNNSSKAE